jgi:hypothetical protein
MQTIQEVSHILAEQKAKSALKLAKRNTPAKTQMRITNILLWNGQSLAEPERLSKGILTIMVAPLILQILVVEQKISVTKYVNARDQEWVTAHDGKNI